MPETNAPEQRSPFSLKSLIDTEVRAERLTIGAKIRGEAKLFDAMPALVAYLRSLAVSIENGTL